MKFLKLLIVLFLLNSFVGCGLGLGLVNLAYEKVSDSMNPLATSDKFNNWHYEENKENTEVTMKKIEVYSFPKEKLVELARFAIDRYPKLSYEIVKKYNLPVNVGTKRKSLCQKLFDKDYYEEGLDLIRLGAEIEDKNGFIEKVARQGKIDIVKKMLKNGFEMTDDAFYYGIIKDRSEDGKLTQFFLSLPYAKKYNINHKPYYYNIHDKPCYDETLLYKVVDDRHYSLPVRLKIMEVLLRMGANTEEGISKAFRNHVLKINIDYDETPLTLASTKEERNLLIRFGANKGALWWKEKASFISEMKIGSMAREGMVVRVNQGLALVQNNSGQQKYYKIEDLNPLKSSFF